MSSRQQTIEYLKFIRSISNGILDGIPEAKLTHLCSPHDNHPMWVLGHLAATDHWIAGNVGATGTTWPDGWNDHFGQGTKPVADGKKYPPAAEVKKVFEANRKAVLAWLEKAPESSLNVSLKEKTSGFANDPIDACLKLGWHEGWHMGQAASVRKALGLKPVMG